MKNWLKYNDKVLVIERNKKNKPITIQVNGTMCQSMSVQGEIVHKFKTKSKWFNPDWWYTKTSWGHNYPNKIYFADGSTLLEQKNYAGGTNEYIWSRTNQDADKHARPVENILKAILKEVNTKTKKQFELDFTDLQYGEYWYEAYVPLKYKNKRYILTWQNCD